MSELLKETTVILENERALIRPLSPADHEHLLPFSLNEPEIWHYSLSRPDSAESLTAYIKAAMDDREKGNSYPFIIFDKQTNSYAGSTRYYDIQPTYKTLLMGYTWYGGDFQGTGLNKNCKYLLLKYAFEDLGMERVEFRADNSNHRSLAAMKSIGCKLEGVLRNHMPDGHGGRRDSAILSILRKEWFDFVKANLEEKL
ncbi:RimJ/RimL family protein N-acetyltransferase [Pedobacter cryoconitis]|uniref:RimJ/RimL family protein N-acetyltransferase n=1 Tax=Pedobacter cryoconitis TaxID=188932 RepID=A0A7W8YVK3_9SPHI|nr:GNAT family protein [Pedobacter cryoconitis]MBB5622632.1 RimJ/RimL family protein N-acetyltransferase [Pedobacter cryoconitis]MBB5648785.1 RimJ/RimL family protein N-acetyltransferase [Pedobacter cryoconitis]